MECRSRWLQQECLDRQKALGELTEQHLDLQRRYDELKQSHNALQLRQTATEEHLSNALELVTEKTVRIDELEYQLQSLQSSLAPKHVQKLESRLAKAKSVISTQKKEVRERDQEVQTLQQTIGELTATASRLQETHRQEVKLSAERASEIQNNEVHLAEQNKAAAHASAVQSKQTELIETQRQELQRLLERVRDEENAVKREKETRSYLEGYLNKQEKEIARLAEESNKQRTIIKELECSLQGAVTDKKIAGRANKENKKCFENRLEQLSLTLEDELRKPKLPCKTCKSLKNKLKDLHERYDQDVRTLSRELALASPTVWLDVQKHMFDC